MGGAYDEGKTRSWRALTENERVADLIFPQQRYGCIQCGKSCGHWRIWVEPELLPSLREHPLSLRLEVAGNEYLMQEADGWHRLGYDAQGACFFLQPDNLCGLHATTGWKSKPRACRQFPFFLLETPDGIQVGLSFRCSAVQQDRGVEWEAHSADLRSLVDSGQYPKIGFEGGPVEWNIYLGWEAEWTRQLKVGQTLAQVFWQHFREQHQLCLDFSAFQLLLRGWTLSALALLQVSDAEELPVAGSDPESVRYLVHVLERKSVWLGSDFTGRMLLVLVAENLLWWAYQRFGNWASAFDLVDGQWLAHREDLGPVERGLAATLAQFYP